MKKSTTEPELLTIETVGWRDNEGWALYLGIGYGSLGWVYYRTEADARKARAYFKNLVTPTKEG